MKYGQFAAAAALVIGTVALGSSATQGQGVPPGDAPPERDATVATAKNPDAPTQDAADVSSDLVVGHVFIPIDGYRTYDSRINFPGRIFTGDEQVFSVLTDEFDIAQIPLTASAVTYNITVTGTRGGGGYLAIYPADIYWPGNASINWTYPGTTVGNGGTTAIGLLTEEGQIEVTLGSDDPSASTDYIIDITGYYVPLEP
jgi:hypothetical protein